MKTQKTLNRGLKLIVKLCLGFIIGISFGFGVGKFIKEEKQIPSSIENTIQQNNNLESLEKHISTVGILEEAKRINDSLKIVFDNYEEEDIMVIKTKTTGKTELLNLRDGNIL